MVEPAASESFRTRATFPASRPSVLAAPLSATMSANHTESNPHQRSNKRRDEGVEPKRPSKAPEKEVELDILSVLEHEDEQQTSSNERGNSYSAEPAPPLVVRGVGRAVILILLCHRRVEPTQA